MKKSICLMMCLCALLSIGVSGCSSDDTEGMGMSSGDIQKGDGTELVVDSIQFYQEINVPCIPVRYDQLPDWLHQVIEGNDGHRWVNTTVIRGRWNGQYVYNVHSDLMSTLTGSFYDQDGNIIQFKDFEELESLIYGTKDWTCILNNIYY